MEVRQASAHGKVKYSLKYSLEKKCDLPMTARTRPTHHETPLTHVLLLIHVNTHRGQPCKYSIVSCLSHNRFQVSGMLGPEPAAHQWLRSHTPRASAEGPIGC